MEEDCDDDDASVGDRTLDQDCDGTPTADDCDDDDAGIGFTDDDEDCDGVPTAEDCDDSNPEVSTVDGARTCPAESCLHLLEEWPSVDDGEYWIDLLSDGRGPFSVFCHQSSHGGGWANVYAAAHYSLDSTTIDYDLAPDRWSDPDEVLIGYTDESLSAIEDTAVFDLPTYWRTQAPMGRTGSSTTVMARINDDALVSATLVYGWGNWSGGGCEGVPYSSSSYGKIAVCDTEGPYWSRWANIYADACNLGTEGTTAGTCSTSRRFSIWVR